MLVENIEGLNGNKIANQFVIRDGGNIYFQSYDSLIAKIDTNGKVSVSSHWDYSNTTSKYFYKFMRDYSRYSIRRKKEMQKLLESGEIKEELNYEVA